LVTITAGQEGKPDCPTDSRPRWASTHHPDTLIEIDEHYADRPGLVYGAGGYAIHRRAGGNDARPTRSGTFDIRTAATRTRVPPEVPAVLT